MIKTRGPIVYRFPDNSLAVIEKLEAGLPYSAFDKLQHTTRLSPETIADLLQIAPRTLARRKFEGKFKPDESDRLLRASTLFDKAINLFDGDAPAAVHWLQSPQPALANHTPLQLAKTDIGVRHIEDLIGRLDHGVFT